MCSPALFMLASTMVSAAGQVQQANVQSDVASRNASVLHQQAQDASERGTWAANQQRNRVQHLLASQTVAAGSSGAAVESKSFGDVMTETAALGEADAQMIRLNAQREAWGLEQQSQGQLWQAKVDKRAGLWSAGGTALTGFTGAYKQAWAQGDGMKPKWW